MQKRHIHSLKVKNRIVHNIIDSIAGRDGFLILGHHNPDEDCISSMVAMALLIRKFSKSVQLFLPETIHEKYQYLLGICRFNSINIIKKAGDIPPTTQAVVIMDTPKPEMIQGYSDVQALLTVSAIRKIEIDHHLDADSLYAGDRGYCLVTTASSSAELVGYLALKLRNRPALLSQYHPDELFSRNFVLAVLTGIIGDTKMGKFLKSRREEWFYRLFSTEFSQMLSEQTHRNSVNLSSMKDVYAAITSLSKLEEEYVNFMMERIERHPFCSSAQLTERDMSALPSDIDMEFFTSAARSVADMLAEDSGYVGMVAYYDPRGISDLVQYRLRRSQFFKQIDLRDILHRLEIENGGGHEGAVGFRIEKWEISDLKRYSKDIVDTIGTMVSTSHS